MITSSTSSGFTLARSSAPLIAALPRSCAGTLPNAPLKEPMAVRAALAMTMSLLMKVLLEAALAATLPSAPDRGQRLETLAVTAAEVDLGAVLQADAPVTAHP